MRNVMLNPVTDTSVFDKPMTRLTALTKAPGGVERPHGEWRGDGGGSHDRQQPHDDAVRA